MRPLPPILLIAALGLAACDAREGERAAPMARPIAQAPIAAPPPVAPPVRPPSKAQEPARPASGLLPLARILAIAQAQTPGDVIEVEFDDGDDDDPPAYEVKILTPEGRSIETTIHARTGAILDLEED